MSSFFALLRLTQAYPVADGRNKTVHYWIGRVEGDDDVSDYAPNHEIDEVAWVGRRKAAKLLTYPHDGDTLREALAEDRVTRTLIVLRHANARSTATAAPKSWRCSTNWPARAM